MAFSKNRPNLQRFLERLTARSVLTSNEQQIILDLPGRVEHVAPNRDFVRLGERADHSNLVVGGIVGRFGQRANGKRQITAMHVPGDMADLHSLMHPTGSSALQALSTATIFKIPHASIQSAAANHSGIAEALWRDCMVDSAILSEWVVNVGRRGAKGRIAHLLCEIATRLDAVSARGAEQGELIFPFAVTQAQLADATGLTPVHVNRMLQSMRRSGLADVTGRTVRIPDWDALTTVGEFDPSYLKAEGEPVEPWMLSPV